MGIKHPHDGNCFPFERKMIGTYGVMHHGISSWVLEKPKRLQELIFKLLVCKRSKDEAFIPGIVFTDRS